MNYYIVLPFLRSSPSNFLLFSFPLPFSLSLSRDRVYRRDCATSTHDRRADADLKRNFENGTLSAAPARQVLQRPPQHRSGIRRASIDFSNLTLTIITTNLFFSFSKLFLVTWIRLFRVTELAILAEAAPELGVTLHREHAEYRHILVLLFRPPYPLLAHRLGLQVKLARQSFAQRVRGHFSLTTTLFNHLQIKLRCQISKNDQLFDFSLQGTLQERSLNSASRIKKSFHRITPSPFELGRNEREEK